LGVLVRRGLLNVRGDTGNGAGVGGELVRHLKIA
jgi:hypothetical protein